MPKLPVITGKKMIKILEKSNFYIARIRGSHFFLKHKNNSKLRTTVPVHGKESLRSSTLMGILLDINMKKDEFLKYL